MKVNSAILRVVSRSNALPVLPAASESPGVESLAPPKQEPWGTIAVLKDPDGNQIALSSR
jgi:predicted enzyme related to lactoylglutathione lyase